MSLGGQGRTASRLLLNKAAPMGYAIKYAVAVRHLMVLCKNVSIGWRTARLALGDGLVIRLTT